MPSTGGEVYKCPVTGKYKLKPHSFFKASFVPWRALRSEPSLYPLALAVGFAGVFAIGFCVYELGWNPDVTINKKIDYPWQNIKQTDNDVRLIDFKKNIPGDITIDLAKSLVE